MGIIFSLSRDGIAEQSVVQNPAPEMELTNTQPSEGGCKIFKLPDENICADSVSCFQPQILRIGPYHHESSSFERMELVKLTCLHSILGSNSENNDDRHRIMTLANDAKNFYSEIITMGEENFARMLLLDGCFILSALTGMQGRAVENVPCETARTNQGTTSNDTMGHRGGGQRQVDLNQHELLNRHVIVHDLLLVENQIPFFILEEVRRLAAPEGETTESLKEKIATYVKGVLHHYPKAIDIPEICSKDFHHLLHLCHMFFRPSQNLVEHHCIQAMIQRLPRFRHSNPVMNQFMSCFRHRNRSRHSHYIVNQWQGAVQYRKAGVEFRVKESSTPFSLLDVTFSNGTMEIPHLSIDAKTESIFSNLIMFERGYPRAGKYINAYVTFMSQLLGTADDVDLLVQKGIIYAAGGRNEQVSNIFNRLNGLAVFDPHGEDYYLKSTLQSVEAHYVRRLNWWMAWFMHNHLTNPCVIIAGFLGFLVILYNVIQGPFHILQYFKPRH